MSKYTTQVRYICEAAAGLSESEGANKVGDIIAAARTKIFDFDYPIFDPLYKPVLETKILRHYYTREIGSETVGLWKLWLEDTMNLIMPYYNKLYNSELLNFNPLYDVDLTIDHSKEGSGENSRTEGVDETKTGTFTGRNVEDRQDSGTTDANNWSLYSDTPQGGINGLIDDDDPLTENNYLTNATRDIEHGTQSNTGNTTTNTTNSTNDTIGRDTTESGNYTNTEDYLEHVRGKRGGITYAKMLMEYRDTFLNIDKMIINDLKELFLNLW